MAIALAVAGLAGCILESPKYDGTQFSCAEPPFECPDGYSCVEEVCRAPGENTTDPLPPDAGSVASPDAETPIAPDAAPGPLNTVTLSGTNITFDTYLRAYSPDDNYGSRDVVAVDADPLKTGLLRFDLSTIPATAQVVSAEIVLSIPDPIEDGEFVVYLLLEDWEENQATWNHRKSNVPWTTAGAGPGSHAATPLFSTAPRNTGVYTIPLPVAAVQAWIAQPQANYGMQWTSTSTQGRGGEFHSSERGGQDIPVVRVQYR